MAQKTAKSLAEALLWIQTNRHHEVGSEYADGEGPDGSLTHIWYRNHQDKIRVSTTESWSSQFGDCIDPQDRPHDDRMYMVNESGQAIIAGLYDPKAHP